MREVSCTHFVTTAAAQREKFRNLLEQSKGKWTRGCDDYEFDVFEMLSTNQVKFTKASCIYSLPFHTDLHVAVVKAPLYKAFEWFWKLYKKHPSEKKISLSTKYFSPTTCVLYGRLLEDDMPFCWLKSYEVDNRGVYYICTAPVQWQEHPSHSSLAKIEVCALNIVFTFI
jgi:hypothetical protein